MAKQKKDYHEDFQKALFTFMLSDPTNFALSQTILKPEYFDDRLKRVMAFVLDYYQTYTKVPTKQLLFANTQVDIDYIDPAEAEAHREWYLTEVEQFCRHRALEQTVLKGPDMLEQGDYGVLEGRVRDAMIISLQRNLGTDYFADPKGRLEAMRDNSNYISTGWKTLDKKLYGGFAPGTLNVFAGGPGSGKSLFLQNLALNYVLGGFNVVYFSLELSEDLVSMRLDAIISSMPTKEIFKRLDEVDLRVRMKGRESQGKLQIVKLPEAGTNANVLRGYLKEYEIQSGIKPEVIIVDYLDLMHPNDNKINPADLFVKDKYTSEEMRAIGHEYHAIMITASQLNRQSVEFAGHEFDQSHIAGGISKLNTADNVFGIHTNQAMRERGEYILQFLKTRTSSAQGQKISLKFEKDTLRISDPDLGDEMMQRQDPQSAAQQVKARTATTVTPPSPDDGQARLNRIIDLNKKMAS